MTSDFICILLIPLLIVIDCCEYYLTQNNVEYGTYRIMQSGTYCLQQNIIFNPIDGDITNPNHQNAWFPTDNESYPGCISHINGAYVLGFFAVITIEISNVILNLNGYKISYHKHFYLQQRFGSIIEIGISPFLPNFGPAHFGNEEKQIENITIYNGELGLTSHHGIHSNNVSNVTIKHLKIYDFEVGAIQLNGFHGAYLANLDIGPSLQNVPLTGYYSNARFLLLALRKLLAAIYENDMEMPHLSFSYMTSCGALSLQQIHDNLVKSMDLVFREITGQILTRREKNNLLYKKGVDLFKNEKGFPDGSALYGILLNSHSVAVNGFGDSLNEEYHGEDVMIDNVNIHDLILSVNEIPGVYFDECDLVQSVSNTILKGPFGDVMDIRKMIDKHNIALIDEYDLINDDLSELEYIGNPLSDAQIAVYLYGDYIGDDSDYRFGSYISSHFLRWALNDYETDNEFPSKCVGFICNGDIMFHTNKGVMGLRIDGIENVTIKDLQINNLMNMSPLTLFACNNYTASHDGGTPGSKEREGGMGTDLRGISIIDSDVVIDGNNNNNNNILRLNSFYGDCIGIDIMGDTLLEFENNANIHFNDIFAATQLTQNQYDYLLLMNKTPYPNNFKFCNIKNDENSTIIINQQENQNQYQDDCKIPQFVLNV